MMFDLFFSIEGFCTHQESDMYLHPDLDITSIFPWTAGQGKAGTFNLWDIKQMEHHLKGILKVNLKRVY